MRKITLFLVSLLLSTPYSIQAMTPRIQGTAFRDANDDGWLNTGEELPGVSISLYEDDGDGLFGSGDSLVGGSTSGWNGRYQFNGLNPNKGYFVQQPLQAVDGVTFSESVSPLFHPGEPAIVIDEFNTTQSVMVTPIATTDQSTMASSHVLGGERDLYLEFASGAADARLRSNPFGLTSVLEFDECAGVVATTTVTWDGLDADASPVPAMGLHGIDLTSGGVNSGLAFNMGVDSAGAGEELRIRIYQGDASRFSEASVPIPVTNGLATTNVELPFSAFVGVVSPTNIDALQLILGGSHPSIDAQIDRIGVFGPVVANFKVSPVPEPVAGLALAWGAALLMVTRRRARMDQAAPSRGS